MAETRVVETAAPTDRPTFTIMIGGAELSREYQVTAIVVTKLVNRISHARLLVLDGDPASEDFPVSNLDLVLPGKEIEILAGYHSEETPIFKGIIIKHGIKARQRKQSVLCIECKHAAVKTAVRRCNRYFIDQKDSEAMETILADYSLASDIAATGISHADLVQFNSLDWDFIVSRAEKNGMLVFTNDEKVTVKKPDLSQAARLSLLYGATMMRFEAEMDARFQFSGVKGVSWDYAGQEVTAAEAAEPEVTSQGNVDGATLADALGLDAVSLQHTGHVEAQELQAWGDAQLLKSRLAKIRGSVSSVGYADINPGDLVELKGVGERYTGNAFVSGVRHEIGNGTWTSDIQFGLAPQWFSDERELAETPAAGLLPPVHGLQIGIVVQLEGDPDGEDRVLVTMPIMQNDSEGVWARVATLDAGENRGSFFRPEINDEVVLGFFNDDPRDPVIVGMLNSSAKPAPVTASDDNHVKGFVSRSGMKLLFDDDKKSITMETPAGKKIIVDEDAGAITVQDENGNVLEMSASGITIESAADLTLKAAGDISVEGTNINEKANAQFKAEGGAGAELSTSAVAVVKGSMVQIN